MAVGMPREIGHQYEPSQEWKDAQEAAKQITPPPADPYDNASVLDLLLGLFASPTNQDDSGGGGGGGGYAGNSPQVNAALQAIFNNLGIDNAANVGALDSQEADIRKLSAQYARRTRKIGKGLQRANRRATRSSERAFAQADRRSGRIGNQTARQFAQTDNRANSYLGAFGAGEVGANSAAADFARTQGGQRTFGSDLNAVNRMGFNDNRLMNSQWRADALLQNNDREVLLMAQIAKARADQEKAYRDQQAALRLQGAQGGYTFT